MRQDKILLPQNKGRLSVLVNVITVLEEEQLSFISYQSEAEDEAEEADDLASELSCIEEGPPSLEQSPGPQQEGMKQLCMGSQVLRISEKLSQMLQDTDPQGIFSQVHPPDSEGYARQMSIIEQILKENPDFHLSDLEFDSDMSNLTRGRTQEDGERAPSESVNTRGQEFDVVDGHTKGVQVEKSLEEMILLGQSNRTDNTCIAGKMERSSSVHKETESGIKQCLEL